MNNSLIISILKAFLLWIIMSSTSQCQECKLDNDTSKSETSQNNTLPKITVSKETTYFTAPLCEDGSLDCSALLNKICSEGVTTENNSAVLIWQALGPKCIPKELREHFFRLIGMPTLSDHGEYLIPSWVYFKQEDKKNDQLADEPLPWEVENIFTKQFEEAKKRPWNKEEFPLLADLLSKNETSLKLISEAVHRKRFYSPLLSDELVIGIDFKFYIRLRDVARQLLIRAMLHLNEGHCEETWQDLLTCFRLSRLMAQQPLIIEYCFASSVQRDAAEGLFVMSHHINLSFQQARKFQKDLNELPPLIDYDKIWNLGERIFEVGNIYDLARHKPELLEYLGISSERNIQIALQQLATDPKMDWNEVLRLLNKIREKMLEAHHKFNYAAAREALGKLDQEINEAFNKVIEPDGVNKVVSPQTDHREKARCFVAIYSNNGTRYYSWTIVPLYLIQTTTSLNQLALAISAYHTENHKYPATLAELTPKYITKIPQDSFSSRDFIYKTQDNGYLIYSVGPNGKDEGGKNYERDTDFGRIADLKFSDEEKSTDDIAIRVPPKKN